MKKFFGSQEQSEHTRIASFNINYENVLSCLSVYLFKPQHHDYERMQTWLQNNHGIISEIEKSNTYCLVFRSTVMSALMALYILKSGSYFLENDFNAIDLVGLIIKLKPYIRDEKSRFIFQELKAILVQLYDRALIDYQSLNKIATNLCKNELSLPLFPEFNNQNIFEYNKMIFTTLLDLHVISTKLCSELVKEILVVVSSCNEVAHRAVVAIDTLTNIDEIFHEELLCLYHAYFEGNSKIITQNQIDARKLLTEFLRKFKLPESLLLRYDQLNHDLASSQRSEKKLFCDPMDRRTQPIVRIYKHDITALACAVSQLQKVKLSAKMILDNYDQIRSYTHELQCIITPLLPESSCLISGFFHKYNSHYSPLIAALLDRDLDQAANLQLFSDLSKTMPYQQTKLSILIYDENKFLRSEFMSPLCYAVEHAIPAVVRILLEHHSTVNPIDNRKTPLQRAMTRGNLEIIQLLLEFGARPDLVTNDDRYSTLHYAENDECTGFLIDWIKTHSSRYPNIDPLTFVDARDRYGNTPLHRIAQRKIYDTMNYGSGNKYNNVDMKSSQHLRLLQLFIDKNADVNAVNLNGHSALHFVLMLNNGQKQDDVHLPTQISAVKLLVKSGANVNAISHEGLNSKPPKPFNLFSPLLGLFDHHYFCSGTIYNNKQHYHIYLLEVSQLLVDHGALINIFDEKHKTPLIKAVILGAYTCVEYLLSNRANPNMRVSQNKPTPLHYCMKMTVGLQSATSQINCLEQLFKYGANPLLQLECNLVLKYESKMGINTFTVNSHSIHPYVMQLILDQKNEFSDKHNKLGTFDNNETVEERFLRTWTVLNVNNLVVNLKLNALEYSYLLTRNNGGPHNKAVVIFNDWLRFYRSHNVKNLLNVLCKSPLWAKIPNELVISFANQFSDSYNQKMLLQQWIFNGRNLV